MSSVSTALNVMFTLIFVPGYYVQCFHCTQCNICMDFVFSYPATMEEFYQSRLPDTFNPAMAGKRMKLPTPETWETQVSLKGNKATTWQELIGRKHCQRNHGRHY